MGFNFGSAFTGSLAGGTKGLALGGGDPAMGTTLGTTLHAKGLTQGGGFGGIGGGILSPFSSSFFKPKQAPGFQLPDVKTGSVNIPADPSATTPGQFEQRLGQIALGEGLTPQAQALMQQQQLQQQQQLGLSGQQFAGSEAQQQANLSRFGASSGARERLSSRLGEQQALGAQDIRSTGAQQALGIRAGSEEQRFGTLSRLGDVEVGRAESAKTRQLQDVMSQRDFMARKLQAEAAERAAQAAARAQIAASRQGQRSGAARVFDPGNLFKGF